MKENKKEIIISVMLFLSFIIFTILVKTIDVKTIGPNSTSVGFSTLNGFMLNKIGVNMVFYQITEVLGLIPILIAALYGIKGIMQLVKRKSLFKVDSEIIILGIFYVITIIIYLFFEKFIVNYRPVLMDGKLEASYPSSHTMISIFISLSAIIVNRYLIKNSDINKKINIFILIIMLAIVVGRTISGVHWFSDILGGLLISSFLIKSFDTVLKIKKQGTK